MANKGMYRECGLLILDCMKGRNGYMTIVDGKYPNKKDLTPKLEEINEEQCVVEDVVVPDELPLADPADSDSKWEYRFV